MNVKEGTEEEIKKLAEVHRKLQVTIAAIDLLLNPSHAYVVIIAL